MAPRVPPRVAVHAKQALDLCMEARLLKDLPLDGVLESFAEFDEAAREGVATLERLFSAGHKNELSAMEEDRVDRHPWHVPRQARHSRLGVRMPAFFANAIASS